MGAPDLSKLTSDQLEILESILEKRTSYERFCEDSELFPGEAPARPHRVICALAQMVADGEIPRLMLFAGPGTAKSTYISKRLVAWLVGYRPGIKIIGASHTKTLAEKHGRESRNIIDNDAYRMIFPEVRLAKDLQARADWATLDDAQYFGVGFDGGIAGRRCDIAIIDDPFTGRKQADSETERENRWTVYQSDIRRRLRKDGGIILMHQRWHDDDIAGRILPADWDGRSGWVTSRTGEEWFVANLQMECEFPENDLLGRKLGELLWPEWFDAARIKQEKLEGVREWNAQFQGFPRDSEGGILKRSWWRKWPGQRPPVVDYVVQVYDTAFEEDEEDDYSARTTWGVFDIEHQDNAAVIAEAVARGTLKPWEWDGKRGEVHRYHAILLERMRERLDFPALRKAAKDAYRAYKPDRVLIEKKASGHSLLQELRRARIPVSAVKADRSKTSRAYASQPAFEQGAVWHMDRSWAQDVIDECATFPTGKHDDVLDTVVHGLMWLRRTYHISGRDENDPEDDDDSDRTNGAPDEIPVRLDR